MTETAKVTQLITLREIDYCPQCGEKIYAIIRSPWSDVACKNKHRWKVGNVIKREQKEDGRWYVVKTKVKYTLVE